MKHIRHGSQVKVPIDDTRFIYAWKGWPGIGTEDGEKNYFIRELWEKCNCLRHQICIWFVAPFIGWHLRNLIASDTLGRAIVCGHFALINKRIMQINQPNCTWFPEYGLFWIIFRTSQFYYLWTGRWSFFVFRSGWVCLISNENVQMVGHCCCIAGSTETPCQLKYGRITANSLDAPTE